MKQRLLFLSLVVMLLGVGVDGWGQFSIEAGSTDYNQDFNTLTSGTWTNNTTLVGWYAKTDATASITTYGANTGSTTAAGLYAFGVTGTNLLTDRALGYAPSNSYTGAAGTGKGYLGWRLKNNTGSSITSITVKWTGEQWRKENNSASHTMNLFYQIGVTVTDLTSGTWTTANSTFTSPIVGATTATALDGNAPANKVVNITAIINVTILDGQEIMFRWDDLNDSGNDHYMAIDDVSINSTIEISATPSIIVGTITDFGSHQINTTSSEKTYNVSGSNLTDDITITPPSGFLISSISGSGYSSNPIILNNTAGTIESTPIYVVFNPTTAQAYSGNITHESTDATTKNVGVSGTGTNPPPPDAPLATDATEIGTTYFTANWGTSAGATGYYLDVYTKTTGGNATDLFISEYIEGSSNNKAIEIFNGTGSSINLSNYSIKKQTNGAGEFGNELVLSGTLAHNEVFVIAYSSASSTILDVADLSTSNAAVNFNGNDAVALYKNSTQIDVIGIINQVSPDWGANVTLVRKSNVSEPTTSYSIGDWDSYASDTFSHLGSHTFIGSSSSSFVSGFEDLSLGNVTSYEVNGLDPNTTYFYAVRAANAYGTSSISNEIEVTTESEPVTSTFTGTGNWSTSERWSSGLPGSTTNVIIDGAATINSDIEITNLTINASRSITVTNTGKLKVSGAFTNSAGTSGLVIESDATGTGSLIHSTAGVAATVERYIVGHGSVATDGWHLIGSPVATFTIDGSSFDPGANDDIYAWNEATNTWHNHKAGDPTQIVPGTGYIVAFENTATKNFSGNLNVADVSVSGLAHTTAQGKGWHLLGNPFASALEWNKTGGSWALTNVAGTAKVWNSTTKAYVDLSANGIIPAAQGFFVQVNEGTTGSLTIPAAARAHSSTAWYKNTAPRLILSASPIDGSSSQESHMLIENEATNNFDFYYDARFLAGYAPQFYSLCGEEKLSTNVLSEVQNESSIPFGFVKNQHENFVIRLEENNLGQNVYLKDLKLNLTHNLSQETEYYFSSTDGDNPNRFLLHFGAVGISEQPESAALKAYVVGAQLYFPLQGEATLEIFDLQGRVLQHCKVSGKGLATQPLQLTAGAYVVRLTTGHSLQTAKVIVK